MTTLLRTRTDLTLSLALRLQDAALQTAEQLGVRVSLCLLDTSGQPVATAHMDGAPAPCRDIARNKANAAVGFGIPTLDWHARLEKASPAVRQGLPLQNGLALFGGGEPLRHAGEVIGAIGVSGASEAQDAEIARSAVTLAATLLADA